MSLPGLKASEDGSELPEGNSNSSLQVKAERAEDPHEINICGFSLCVKRETKNKQKNSNTQTQTENKSDDDNDKDAAAASLSEENELTD